MGQVYQNAFLNIAADHSSEGQDLFFDRDPDYDVNIKINMHKPGSTEIMEWVSVDHNLWITEVNQSPLNNRGWVMQERALSSRVVHFCQSQVFWECREASCCETFPDVLPSPDIFQLGDAVPVWDDIVKAYTRCLLTYPSDKLVAISGVAKYLKSIIRDTYLAGMWRKRLAAELAWWMYPGRDRYTWGEPDQQRYYAPSFSWASVKGQINSSGPFAIGFLVEVECVTLGSGSGEDDQVFSDDVFGISLHEPSFQIRARGKLRPARLVKGKDWLLHIARKLEASQPDSGGLISEKTSYIALEPFLDFTIPDQHTERFEAETFYIICWRYGPDPGEYDMSQSTLYAMILQHVDGKPGQFRRIGWVRAGAENAEEILNAQPSTSLPGYFDKALRTHTIYLI
ncbi:hypothetical protein BX600DRAFT_518564 [Xylariales sp. PMI_506]|nr:hypothetical protein BX600DRAFT_518564 [Xylariales sp. PMI_506]